ncbi:MAG: DUF2510 domain-containing protein [Actinobacteria bacterium]|nr:DUF2510 domain-containing protein [Actinomycetota bacterium]
MGAPEPGWYPDPDDDRLVRYWDGRRWTDRRRERAAAAQAPPAPGGQGAGAQRGRRWVRPLAIGCVLVLALAGAGIAFLTTTGEAEAEVRLQPVGTSGEDPFTGSVATSTVTELAGDGRELGGTVEGGAPGLYGGTGEDAVCDAEALASFLEDNPAKAAAFARVVGVEPGAVGDYVASLTPVVLRADTRVTNHGFRGGRATPFDAVLQAGTAVMVDDRGVPRVRCACGNPLAEPGEASTSGFAGAQWEGFDEGRLVAVSGSGRPLDRFELVDVRTGETYEQAAGGKDGLTVEELLNLEIPVAVCDVPRVPWEDGIHPSSSRTLAAPPLIEVVGVEGGLASEGTDDPPELQAAVGDLTGDGADDGVVTTFETCGGNGSFGETYVFDADGELLDTLPDAVNEPGAAFPEVRSAMRIVDGGIEVTVSGFTADGARANGPSQEDRVRYELDGSGFEIVERGLPLD